MDMKQHVVIIGWDDFSHRVTLELLNAKRKVAIITKNELAPIREEFHDRPVYAIQRNLTSYEAFSEVNIQDSVSVFVNLPKDEDSLMAILNMKKLYKNLSYVVILNNEDLMQTFKTTGVAYVVSKNAITARMVNSYIYEEDVAIAESDFLSATETEEDYDIQQYLVTENNPYVNCPYGEVFWDLKNAHNVISLGLSKKLEHPRQEQRPYKLHKVPDDDLLVEAGDYFVLALQGEKEKDIENIFGIQEGINLP